MRTLFRVLSGAFFALLMVFSALPANAQYYGGPRVINNLASYPYADQYGVIRLNLGETVDFTLWLQPYEGWTASSFPGNVGAYDVLNCHTFSSNQEVETLSCTAQNVGTTTVQAHNSQNYYGMVSNTFTVEVVQAARRFEDDCYLGIDEESGGNQILIWANSHYGNYNNGECSVDDWAIFPSSGSDWGVMGNIDKTSNALWIERANGGYVDVQVLKNGQWSTPETFYLSPRYQYQVQPQTYCYLEASNLDNEWFRVSAWNDAGQPCDVGYWAPGYGYAGEVLLGDDREVFIEYPTELLVKRLAGGELIVSPEYGTLGTHYFYIEPSPRYAGGSSFSDRCTIEGFTSSNEWFELRMINAQTGEFDFNCVPDTWSVWTESGAQPEMQNYVNSYGIRRNPWAGEWVNASAARGAYWTQQIRFWVPAQGGKSYQPNTSSSQEGSISSRRGQSLEEGETLDFNSFRNPYTRSVEPFALKSWKITKNREAFRESDLQFVSNDSSQATRIQFFSKGNYRIKGEACDTRSHRMCVDVNIPVRVR